MNDKQPLIDSLAYWLAAGKLDPSAVFPALQRLTGGTPRSVPALLEALEGETDESLIALARYLRHALRVEALRVHESRKRALAAIEPESFIGLPCAAADEWKISTGSKPAVETAVRFACDLAFLAANRDKAPRLLWEVQRQSSTSFAAACLTITALLERLPESALLQLADAWPPGTPGREAILAQVGQARAAFRQRWLTQTGRALRGQLEVSEHSDDALAGALAGRFEAAASREEKAALLDVACSWMTPSVIPALAAMVHEPWAQDRALWNLTVRFGQPGVESWAEWQRWLGEQHRLWQSEQDTFATLVQFHPSALLLVLYSQAPDPDPAVLDALIGRVAESGQPVTASGLLTAWSRWVPMEERRALLGMGQPRPPVIAEYAAVGQAPAVPAPAPAPPPLVPPPIAAASTPEIIKAVPAAPPKPSVWEAHIQPFFVENWYIVAGIAMVILGSSLLAYYTWDKHWLVRYTLMPLLLGGFTWLLARVGNWIETKGAEFKATAAILRGAAIGLLPINFMAMALLSADEHVPQKVPALLAMALIYLSVFGWGLRKWCRAVEPSLGNVLGGTLLLLNALVAVGPLARTVGELTAAQVLLCLGAGFYLGFAATAAAIIYFARRVLTREMAEEKRVPWFVASVLSVTFVQVFIWVHGFMRHLPHATSYALMVILTGWLILYCERRALELKQSLQLHGGESFLGFGAVLLGLLMGFSDPTVRILSFLAAGGVWLYQALWRRHPLHYWIALTLLGLGGASVALLPQYPGPWLPLPGLVIALLYGLGARLSLRAPAAAATTGTTTAEENEAGPAAPAGLCELAQACRGMQMVALVITALISPLVQWHYNSPPLGTAAWLAAVAGLFAWRAFRDTKVQSLHVTMVILALALPYVGFMDVAGRTAHNNTMVFGLALLSWLWLGAAWIIRSPLIVQARSTVLCFYGVLAVAAMLLRVALGDNVPEPLWYKDCMDYGGPILMMLALIPATYCSRSLVPAGMAVAIMAILYPELKAGVQQWLPWLSWGTGFGSSIWGLLLIGLCFALRPWQFLKDLPEGDPFIGKEPFPFRRHDHTLFTWPILAAAAWLLLKVDTWHFLRNLSGGLLPLKTAVALGISGIAWTFLAVYHRRHRGAVIGVHLGWICMLAAISFGYWQQVADPHWTWPALATGLLIQGLYWCYRFGLEPKRPWVRGLLTEPMRMVLLAGAAGLAAACIAALFAGAAMSRIQWLFVFVLAQVVWHALRTRHWAWGGVLFFFAWTGLLATCSPGSDPLWLRLSVEQCLNPTLWFFIGIQLLLLALEFDYSRRPKDGSPASDAILPVVASARETQWGALAGYLAPILKPVFVLTTCAVAFLGFAGLIDGVGGLSLSMPQQFLLLGAILLTARAQASSALLLPALFLGYLMLHRSQLLAFSAVETRLALLATPWRIGVLGLIIVLLAQAGRWVHQRKATLLAGRFAMRGFSTPACAWLYWPAAVLTGAAVLCHTAHPVLRERPAQLWTPYIGTATFALIALFWRQAGFFAAAGVALLLGNIHLVRVFGGEFLRNHGLSELHLVCLGLGLTLLQASVLRRALRQLATFDATEGWGQPRPQSKRDGALGIPGTRPSPPQSALVHINRASLGLAALVLALLSANYFTEPNLAAITSMRFVISGALAWLAGWYFRRAAREPGPGEEAHSDLCEALYHYGLVVALWCAALLVPWLRQPAFALVALGLPVVYFHGRAEFGMHRGQPEARRYRNSAAVLGFAVLGLYLFKGIFHIVLFPGVPISTAHYHYNAALMLLLGIVLLRLHGLGGTGWLAFYGGLALMTGSYFLLTWLPGFSPFHYPMPAAWCALGLAHFWILLSYSRSPLRTFIQRLARLDDPAWHSLRRSWGRCLLAATQGAVVWGLVDWSSNTYMVAPLLAGAASIFVHQGIIRRSPAYLIAAGIEVAVALHMDVLVPSYLGRDYIIWVILSIWLALLVSFELLRGKLQPKVVSQLAGVFSLFVLAHVLYHRPWLPVGLYGMCLGAILAAWTPVQRPAGALEKASGSLLLGIPIWLVYFSQARFEAHGAEAGLAPWPILSTTATLFIIGLLGRWFQKRWAVIYHSKPRTQPRLFDLTLGWIESDGYWIQQAALWIATSVVCAAQALHYQTAFAPREFGLLILLQSSLAAAWFFEGKTRPSMMANYLMQLCAVACFASIRRHLMLTIGGWNYEYDIWASLVCSFALAGAKQLLAVQSNAARVPLVTSLCTLPVVALCWVIVHRLGVNLALVVIGLHSVLFAFLGKDNRESPYNVLALSGFVSFILLTFYSKLHLQAVNAYIIPVGLGLLLLQELFKKHIRPEAQNWIRLVTLMAMLGSSGYYALADTSHAVTFNLTMIVLCLLAMALGSVLRIRLYLALGFAGLMVDLLSLLYKVLVLMERSARMTVVGSLVLVIGAALVFGAIYYKTNKAKLDAWMNEWRLRLAQWQ